MRFLRKDPPSLPASIVDNDGGDSVLVGEFPAILEYLTSAEWEDGQCRETSTLLIFQEDGFWKVCLNDRSLLRSLWASGSSLPGAIRALEMALQTGSCEWRRSQPRKRK